MGVSWGRGYLLARPELGAPSPRRCAGWPRPPLPARRFARRRTQYLASAPTCPITRLAAGPVTTRRLRRRRAPGRRLRPQQPDGRRGAAGRRPGRLARPLVSQISSSTSSSAEAIAAADFSRRLAHSTPALADFASGPPSTWALGDGRCAGSGSLGGDRAEPRPGRGRLQRRRADRPGPDAPRLHRRGAGALLRGDSRRGLARPSHLEPCRRCLALRRGRATSTATAATTSRWPTTFGNRGGVHLMGSATLRPTCADPSPRATARSASTPGGAGRGRPSRRRHPPTSARTVSILHGDGTGSLGRPRLCGPGGPPRSVRLGNFDAGGRLDIAASGLGVWTYASNGTGGFLRCGATACHGPLAVAQTHGRRRPRLVAGPEPPVRKRYRAPSRAQRHYRCLPAC